MGGLRDVMRSGGEADFAAPAELIGHPARAAMLLALLDGRALPMSMLAGEAGVSPATASAHLTRLVDGDLLRVIPQGRRRYYELASAQVAAALEELARLAPARPVRSMRAWTRERTLRAARTCYDHLAGRLGVAVMGSLLERSALVGGDGRHDPSAARDDRLAGPGRAREYRPTDAGWALFDRLGVAVPPAGRRRLVGYCVDWTEQRHHLAGALGAALLDRVERLGWVERGARGVTRALRVTDAGQRGFAEYFELDTADLADADPR